MLKLSSESIEHVVDSLAFLLKTRGSCKDSKFFLLNLERQLVTYLAQFFFEVDFVTHGLLRLVCEQGQLLRQEGDLLRLSKVLSDNVQGVLSPSD